MSFDWAEFFNVAEVLCRNPDGCTSEAALRSAVGRAYYAAFGHLKVALQSDGFVPKNNGGDHAGLVKFLEDQNQFARAAKLRRLHEWRKAADYKANPQVRAELAAQAIRTARDLLGHA